MSTRVARRHGPPPTVSRPLPPLIVHQAQAGWDAHEDVAETERLRAELTEVQAWYSLLRDDQERLRSVHARTTREATVLQTECNRLAAENERLQALAEHPRGPSGVARTPGSGAEPTVRHQEVSFVKFVTMIKSALKSRWVLPAVAIVALAAREPMVRDLFASAVQAVRPSRSGESAEGYLAYARMVNA